MTQNEAEIILKNHEPIRFFVMGIRQHEKKFYFDTFASVSEEACNLELKKFIDYRVFEIEKEKTKKP